MVVWPQRRRAPREEFILVTPLHQCVVKNEVKVIVGEARSPNKSPKKKDDELLGVDGGLVLHLDNAMSTYIYFAFQCSKSL